MSLLGSAWDGTGRDGTARPPSGQQFEIRAGDQRATIVEVGGGVRCYSSGRRDVFQPYPAEALCDGAHGAPLIPWPGRLADGRYRFDGADYQVPLTEPAKHNAIHGFLRWQCWQPLHQEPSKIVMATTLSAREGYPFTLDVRAEYALSDAGLTVATTASNVGGTTCPYGSGQHPYLSPGTGAIDACTLQLDAGTRILTDQQRQLPAGTEPTSGTSFDFRSGRVLGGQRIDDAFTNLVRDERGLAWVRLIGPDGRAAELWLDSSYPVVEIYTADDLAPDRRRRGLGTEPMTCGPNAFQTGRSLIRLKPGGTVTTRWGARLIAMRIE